MRTITRTLVTFTASLLVGFAFAGPTSATPITGSDTVSAAVSSSNAVGGNLGTATQFTLGSASQTFSVGAVGSGSFALIPVNTTVPLPSASFNLANLASFGFTSPTVGTFTPTAITSFNKTPTSLDLFLTGGGKRRQRTSVKRIVGRENLVLATAFFQSVAARELDGRFIGFGSAVAEKSPIRERMAAQLPG